MNYDEIKKDIFRCMVRQLLKWRAGKDRLKGIEWLDKQDEETRKVYKEEANRQWDLGNRGEHGVWFD